LVLKQKNGREARDVISGGVSGVEAEKPLLSVQVWGSGPDCKGIRWPAISDASGGDIFKKKKARGS